MESLLHKSETRINREKKKYGKRQTIYEIGENLELKNKLRVCRWGHSLKVEVSIFHIVINSLWKIRKRIFSNIHPNCMKERSVHVSPQKNHNGSS